jgi:hypothetical protein
MYPERADQLFELSAEYAADRNRRRKLLSEHEIF